MWLASDQDRPRRPAEVMSRVAFRPAHGLPTSRADPGGRNRSSSGCKPTHLATLVTFTGSAVRPEKYGPEIVGSLQTTANKLAAQHEWGGLEDR